MAARFCWGIDPKDVPSGALVAPDEPFFGFATRTPQGPRWTGRVELVPDALEIPLKRRKPTTYFVNSMSDLFHEALADDAIDRVFAVMALCPQHRFICLTKRAARMAWYCEEGVPAQATADLADALGLQPRCIRPIPHLPPGRQWWPLPNVTLGVSCEDQAAADERIPHLLRTPAACRMVSLEPLLGPIDLKAWLTSADAKRAYSYILREHQMDPATIPAHLRIRPAPDWVIVGGESGPGARPMHPDWARSLRDQCTAAGVPFFFKQWGEWQNGSDKRWNGSIVLSDGTVHPENYAPTGDLRNRWPEFKPTMMARVGKKVAGRLLDGRVWDERPGVLR